MAENIQQIDIEQIAKEEFIPYAGQSLINFLPSIDGCLPVHRKIGISMLRNGRLPNNPFIKSVKAMGEIVTYYIYGTSGLYQSMVNIANNNMNIPMLLSKGSWGDKRRKDGYASAERYTDCKASEYLLDMMKGLITKSFVENVVPMKPNFDNTTDEMIVMPSLPPNILLNMSQSISLSEASKIPSFNVIETCDSFISYIKDNDMDKAINIIKTPDFNFGGQIIYNKEIFDNIYKTGRGSFTLLGKYRYDEEKRLITVYEIPFNTTIDDIEDKLRNAYDKGLFKEVVDIHNGCGKDGISLDIYLKRNTNIKDFIFKLRKYTPYESKFSCNFTILDLDWKTPKLMSLQDIFDKWIQHRVSCISNELSFDIEKNKKQLHLLEGLKIILLDLDKTISIIRASKNDSEAINQLKNIFNLDDIQAENISSIKLINLNKDYILKRIKEIENIKKEINKLELTLKSKEKILNIIIDQLEYCKKKYGIERRTEIIYPEDIQQISETQLIEEYNTVCYLTKEGYFKKVPATSLRGSASNKLKENDEIIYTVESSNKSTILLFSNFGVCYKLYQHEIEDCKLSNLGLYLSQYLQLDKDEKIIGMVSTRKYTGYLIVSFNSGKIAKIDMPSFKTKTMRSKLENALSLESPMINMFVIEKDIDILLKSSIDKVLVSNTSFINSKASKNTAGNQIQKSKNGSITDLCIPLSQINTECIDVDYYKSESGKGIGNYLRKTDEIKLIK